MKDRLADFTMSVDVCYEDRALIDRTDQSTAPLLGWIVRGWLSSVHRQHSWLISVSNTRGCIGITPRVIASQPSYGHPSSSATAPPYVCSIQQKHAKLRSFLPSALPPCSSGTSNAHSAPTLRISGVTVGPRLFVCEISAGFVMFRWPPARVRFAPPDGKRFLVSRNLALIT